MTHTIRLVRVSLAAASFLGAALFSTPSLAGAKTVIDSRADLSQFRSLLVLTGSEPMLSGGAHTVFAPVNGSFGAYPAVRYPYLYSAGYTEYAPRSTGIAQNHIADGQVYVEDVVKRKGGVFAVNGRFIPISEGARGTYYVDGHRVLSTRMTGNDIVYIIDGLIAQPWETVEIVPAAPLAAIAPAAGTTVVVPENSDVVVEEEVVPGVTRTTTVTTTY